MKQSKLLLVLMLSLTTAFGFAQQTIKPKIFSAYPETINVSETIFTSALNAHEGDEISLDLGDGFIFKGTVISNEIKYQNLQTVTIRSQLFNNTLFAVSKIKTADQNILYVGRMINHAAFDGYEIKRSVAGSYRLQKFDSDHILQDCSF